MNIYAVYRPDGSIKQMLTTVDDFAKVDGSVSDTTHYIDTDSGVGFIETVTDSEPTVIEFELPGHYQVALTGHHHYIDEDIEVSVDG